ALRASATQERSPGEARSSASTPVSRRVGSPRSLPPTAPATSPRVNPAGARLGPVRPPDVGFFFPAFNGSDTTRQARVEPASRLPPAASRLSAQEDFFGGAAVGLGAGGACF